MKIYLSFYEWLMKFENIDLPIGDLAKDVKVDSNFPVESKSKDEIISYLESVSASFEAIETAKQCFNFYKVSHLDDYNYEA